MSLLRIGWLVVLLLLPIGTLVAVEGPPAGNIEPDEYLMPFHEVHFKSPEEFCERAKRVEGPFRFLLTGVKGMYGDFSIEPFAPADIERAEVLVEKPSYAVVFVCAQVFRGSFCGVLFALSKDEEGFAVTDLVRRVGGGHESGINAEVLPLKPRKDDHVHLAITNGGRESNSSYDELYVLKDEMNQQWFHFVRTLVVVDGSYQRGFKRSFSQYATWSASPHGNLQVEIQRVYEFSDRQEKRTKTKMAFVWNEKKCCFQQRRYWSSKGSSAEVMGQNSTYE